MFATLYTQIGAVLVVLVVVFALIKGDEPERIGGVAYALGMLASNVVQQGQVLEGPQWGLFAIDLIMLAVYAGLTWKTRRVWPVWAAAFQALVVASHLLKLMTLQGTSTAFMAVINLAALGTVVALGVGTFWAWQERRAAQMSARLGG